MTFPAVPLGDQWPHPSLPDATAFTQRTDSPLNALRTTMATFGAALAGFRVGLRSTLTLRNGAPVLFDTVVEDTAAGWSAADGLYTVPGPGVYLIRFQLRQSTAVSFTAQIGGIDLSLYPGGVRSGACAAASGQGPEIPLVPIRLNGGEQLAVLPAFGGSVTLQAVSTNEVNFFTVEQVVDGL